MKRFNLANPGDVSNLGFSTALINLTAVRSLIIPVAAGEAFSITRESLTNRFRVVFTEGAPEAGDTYSGGTGNSAARDNDYVIESMVAPVNATHMVVYLSNTSEPIPRILIEKSPVALPLFDGDTPDTPLAKYEWDGTPHASTSTATITTIDAHLLDTGAPNPVQIVVQDLAPGSEYTIRGHRGDFTWTVPGGKGTSDGTQIVLIDNRAPLNAPVTYTLTVSGASISTEPLTVNHHGKFVLQPLNGQNPLTPKHLLKSPGERDLDIQTVLYNVAGRSRPVVRYDKTGMGGSSFSILCTRQQSAELMGMLESGRPLVYRVTVPSDVPSMETIAITSAASEAMPHDGDRTWELGFTYINDPEPNRVLAAYTWAQFNEIYAGQTWAQFNTEWAGQTWSDFNTYDWGQRL